MSTVVGVALIILGLFVISPVGAARSARNNRDHKPSGVGGFRPTSVRGNQLAGIFTLLIGVAFVVT
ncbi:hypothetical protein [Patulibacter americanus]|uniref:hypothetical protein n=1 Tax=Patulibacter americanus TaxID=588672 RepID=UPI0003B60916|nr:hypothetical protein [Patulibacter americanus]